MHWIQNRIEKYGLIEGHDFEVFDNFIKNPSGGRPLTEYALTIDAAKELAMVEGEKLLTDRNFDSFRGY